MSDEATAPAEPPPATWYTEEMVETVARMAGNSNWSIVHETIRELLRSEARAALDAIAPMVEKLLEDAGFSYMLKWRCENCEASGFSCTGCGVVTS